jgi:hypothetical protein
MTQFFFDIIADGKLAPDKEGTNLPDLDAARRKASISLANLARNMGYVEGVQGFPRFAISVRTSDGPVYETVLQLDLETRH